MDTNYKKQRAFNMIKRQIIVFLGALILYEAGYARPLAQGMIRQAQLMPLELAYEKTNEGRERLLSVRFKDILLEDALKQLAKKARVGISYRPDLLSDKRITYTAEDESVFNVLEAVLDGTGLYGTLSPNKKVILIKEYEGNSFETIQERVTGMVTDAGTGETLPGVNVLVKGTSTGTATDASGAYELGVESLQDTLVFSFIGYQSQEVPINGQTQIDVALQSQAIAGDELVVIGYGSVTKSDLTGSVSSIKSEDVTEVPTTNVAEALQGKVSGMDITRNSGEAGSGVSIALRGNRSLTASNSPLIIVDGIQYGSIEDINPADIESIEVLKDASSTAIYGSRGANGVILISTKQGEVQGTQVSLESYTGFSQTMDYPEFNTGSQYVEQKREANRVSGDWSGPEDDPNIFTSGELENIENNVWTDFRDLLFRTGVQQSHQINVSRGTENNSMYLSVNYFDEKGILEKDQLQRYTARLNVDQQIGDALTVGMNSQVTYYDRDQRRDPMNIANKINPLTPAYDEEGELIVRPNNGRDISPLADLAPNAYENNTLTTKVFPTFFAQLNFTDNLSLRTNVSAIIANSRQGIYRSSETIDRNGSAPEAIYNSSNSRNITFENILNYKADFGEHSIAFTGLTSYLFNKNDFGSSLGRNQLLSSQLYYGLLNATEGIAVESGYEESSLMSYAGRLNYSWQDKYLLTLSGRFDGSSKLSEDNRWAFFPSVAGAWRISEEGFIGSNSLFSDIKLRVSYGVSGNDAIDPYSTQSALRRIPFSYDEESAPGFTFSPTLGNPNLEWEISRTANIGLDLGFLNDRILATIDVYDTRTSNLLLDRFLPLSSGVSSVTQNVGKTRNRGIEVALESVNILKDDFSWESSITFFSNKEEIVELVNDGDDIGNGWFIGEPTEVFYDYEKVGIWQLGEADEAASYGQEPGEVKVRDQNGDGVITAGEDRVILGSPRPKWSGGIKNSINYKGFDLSVYVYARIGQMMDYEYYANYKPGGVENGAHVDYWTPDNPTNAFPRPNAALSQDNYQYYSTLSYVSGSFVKIRNATLGYTLPPTLLANMPVRNVRLYVTGKNLYTFAKVDNYDPERGGGLSFPMTRLFVGGINIDF